MGLDLNELQLENERLQSQGKENTGFLDNFVKLPEGAGVVILRFLPPAPAGMFNREKNPFFCSTRTHRLNGRSHHCPRELNGSRWLGECPICSYYSWLWQESEKKSGEEAEKLQDQARSIKPVERYYYNVIVRSVTGPDGKVQTNVGPKIFPCGKTVQSMILRAILGDEEMAEKPLGDITHYTEGRDFKLVKTMAKSGRMEYANYSNSKFLEPSPAGTPTEIEQWTANLHDLKSLRILKDAESLKRELKIHLGLIPDTSAGDSSFDPTEFQKPATSTISVESTVASKEYSPAPKEFSPAPAGLVDSSEPMADDDFIRELQQMK